MQKGKTWQRVASAVLAVMMTMSTFSSTIGVMGTVPVF